MCERSVNGSKRQEARTDPSDKASRSCRLSRSVCTGTLGGKTGIAPRIFLKKLVADLLDRIELYESFDPRKDYLLTIRQDELSEEEQNLLPASSVEQIRLTV
jgi:hypothetical protein